MTGNGLRAPEFQSYPARFVVSLDRFGILNPDVREWLASLDIGELHREQEFALALMHQADSISAQELRQHLAVDSSVAEEALRDLCQRGIASQAVGRYFLARVTPKGERPKASDAAVLEALSNGGAWTIHELSEETGRSAGSLRPVLRRLVERGEVVPTAPPTSRRRAYRLG